MISTRGVVCDQKMDRQRDRPTDGQTHPLIEIRGRILKDILDKSLREQKFWKHHISMHHFCRIQTMLSFQGRKPLKSNLGRTKVQIGSNVQKRKMKIQNESA